MAIYVARRVILLVPVILGVMTVVFILTASLPVSTQISALAPQGPKQPCPSIVPYCSKQQCAKLGIYTNSTCANPAYWRAYRQLGLNRPVYVQWGVYMYRALTFQWGRVGNSTTLAGDAEYSHFKHQNVTTMLGILLPYTLELAVMSLLMILAVAIPLGNLSAVYRNRPIDQASRVMSFSGFALPAYLLGSVAVLGVVLLAISAAHSTAVSTPWCPTLHPVSEELTYSWPQPAVGCYHAPVVASRPYPTWLGGWDNGQFLGLASSPTGFPTVDALVHGDYWLATDTVIRLILPAAVIAFGSIAALLRFVRNSMLEVMNLDYIRTARAKGVPEKQVVKKHAGRNSMNVTITVLGLTFAFFIGGFPVIEEVFLLNGVGRALALAVQGIQDFGTIFGSTILFTYLVVAANIIVDILYAYLDPRVRLG